DKQKRHLGKIKEKNMIRVTLFGDSLMNGYRQGRDTSLVTAGLQAALGPNYQLVNHSLSGATTADGLERCALVDSQSDLVVVEFGTNDCSATWGISRQQYARNLQQLVDRLGADRLLLVGPSLADINNETIMQDYSVQDIDAYNKTARACAKANGIPFVDLIAQLRADSAGANYYQEDGLHFSDRGNRLFVALLADAIKQKVVH
ncbi:SGNH/GDSL hydrolase family protein, partial [Lactobacillus sp. XV13L]|nr:SGNH/GDSL hydrolase family protein [Lactobacillus sp. XV13L]